MHGEAGAGAGGFVVVEGDAGVCGHGIINERGSNFSKE
jgi:hypothetical protein